MGVFHVFQIVPNHATHHSHTIYLPIEKQLLPSCIKPTTLRNFASIVAGVQVLAAVSGLNNFFMATDWLKKQHFHKKNKKNMKAKKNKYFKHFSLNTARVSTLNTKLADDRADPPQLIAY